MWHWEKVNISGKYANKIKYVNTNWQESAPGKQCSLCTVLGAHNLSVAQQQCIIESWKKQIVYSLQICDQRLWWYNTCLCFLVDFCDLCVLSMFDCYTALLFKFFSEKNIKYQRNKSNSRIGILLMRRRHRAVISFLFFFFLLFFWGILSMAVGSNSLSNFVSLLYILLSQWQHSFHSAFWAV